MPASLSLTASDISLFFSAHAIENILLLSCSISMIAPKPATTSSLPGPDSLTPSKRWGFAVYRCDYSDDDQWKSYMYHFKHAVKDELKDVGAHWSIWGRLRWTIIEDRQRLHSASKEDIQERFISLNEQGLTIKMPAPHNDGWRLKHEYNSCIYVDKWCLDTLDLHEAWLDRGAPGPFQPVICAVIHNKHTPDNDVRLERQPIDGSQKPYTGWVYTHVGCLSQLCPSMIQRQTLTPQLPPAMGNMPSQHGL
ncbi:hypothetical protein NCS56_01478100 [Fusarium sp. Ph1]|nr:hypothetical protein NCS56_01478100 [Fusarium sp. Ph1]